MHDTFLGQVHISFDIKWINFCIPAWKVLFVLVSKHMKISNTFAFLTLIIVIISLMLIWLVLFLFHMCRITLLQQLHTITRWGITDYLSALSFKAWWTFLHFCYLPLKNCCHFDLAGVYLMDLIFNGTIRKVESHHTNGMKDWMFVIENLEIMLYHVLCWSNYI